MSRLSDRLADLLVGENRTVTRRAFILAGVFVVLTSTLEYLVILTKFDNETLRILHTTFIINVDNLHTRGALLVVGLAALHAYLNQGYLPTLCLSWSPVYGSATWVIEVFTQMEEFYFDPVFAFERTFPEVVVLATLGFTLGLARRWIHHHYSDTPFSPETSE